MSCQYLGISAVVVGSVHCGRKKLNVGSSFVTKSRIFRAEASPLRDMCAAVGPARDYLCQGPVLEPEYPRRRGDEPRAMRDAQRRSSQEGCAISVDEQLLGGLVEPRCDLIEDQELRFEVQRARQRDALPL